MRTTTRPQYSRLHFLHSLKLRDSCQSQPTVAVHWVWHVIFRDPDDCTDTAKSGCLSFLANLTGTARFFCLVSLVTESRVFPGRNQGRYSPQSQSNWFPFEVVHIHWSSHVRVPTPNYVCVHLGKLSTLHSRVPPDGMFHMSRSNGHHFPGPAGRTASRTRCRTDPTSCICSRHVFCCKGVSGH